MQIPKPVAIALSSSNASQSAVNEERPADAVEKCEAGVGLTLRALVWGAEWLAYSLKYVLVQSYGAVDKTVATGGCRHDASPGQKPSCTQCMFCVSGIAYSVP